MNWKYAILPVIVLLLYLMSVWAMSTQVEPYFTEWFNIITPIIEQMKGKTAEEIQIIQKNERLEEKLQESEERKPTFVFAFAFPIIEKITFGQPNCMNSYGIPCKVYTEEYLVAAQKIPSPDNPFQYATKYTLFDHIQKIITLIIEVLAIQLLIAYAWRKRQQIKKFYAFSKFKIITAIILLVAVILPPMINDDIYFAAPWIWYILAPPMMLELVFTGPSEWIGLVLGLPLLILWCYTLATIIDKVRKSI